MPSPLAEAFLMGILNGCYETPSKSRKENRHRGRLILLSVAVVYS